MRKVKRTMKKRVGKKRGRTARKGVMSRITALAPRTIKTGKSIKNRTVKSMKRIFDKTTSTLKSIPVRLNQGAAKMINSITK